MKVFLHGWGMRKEMFSSFIDKHCNNEQVINLSLPGYDEGCDVIDFDEQVLLLSKLIPDNSHIVAWSLGGLYGLRIAEQFPEKVSRLTMVCSTPVFAKKKDWVFGLDENVLAGFAHDLLLDRSKIIGQFMLLQLHGQKNIKYLVRELNATLKEKPAPSLINLQLGLKFLQEIDFRCVLKAVKAEVCFILGAKDRIVLSKQSSELESMGVNIKVHVIKSAGHIPFITHQDEFASLL